MTGHRMLDLSASWFRLLQRLYPPDFRDEMGNAAVEVYLDRARDTLKTGGKIRLTALWFRALLDSLFNGAPATGAAISSSSGGGSRALPLCRPFPV